MARGILGKSLKDQNKGARGNELHYIPRPKNQARSAGYMDRNWNLEEKLLN